MNYINIILMMSQSIASPKGLDLKTFVSLSRSPILHLKLTSNHFTYKSISRKIHKNTKRSRFIIHWCRQVEGDQRFASAQAGERERGGWEWERIKRWVWNEMMMMTNYNSYNRARTLTCFRENLLEFAVKEKWKYNIKK